MCYLLFGNSLQTSEYFPGLRLDVHVGRVLRDPAHLPQDVLAVLSEHGLLQTLGLVLLEMEASPLCCHVDVGQQSHTAEQLVLGLRSGDQTDNVRGAVGGQQLGDVLVVTGQVYQQSQTLKLDGLLGSVRVRLEGDQVEERWKERVEVMMPVRKNSEVGERQEDLGQQLGVLLVPEDQQ